MPGPEAPPAEARPSPFVGVVLTGGRSTRMGTDKALMVLDGRTMVERVSAVLWGAGAVRVVAVGGDTGGIRALGLAAVDDAYPGDGPLGAFATATEVLAMEPDAAVVLVSCDLPALRSATVRRLFEALVGHAGAVVAVPVVDGVRQVHVVATRASALAVLAEGFRAGERSVQRALRAVEVREVSDVDPSELRDLDSPEDVADYARRSRATRDGAPP